jgi:hypothetical protein
MIDLLAALPFGIGQSGQAHLGRGWSAPEEGFVWSIGTCSEISLTAPKGRGRLVLELQCEPFLLPPELLHQDISLLLDDTLLETRRLGGSWTWRVWLPAAGPVLHLALRREAGLVRAAGDPRDLGLRLMRLTLLRDNSPAPPPPRRAAVTHRFSWCEPTSAHLAGGFGSPHNDYVWAIGRTSDLIVPLDGSGEPVVVLLDMRPFQDESGQTRQRVGIGADGRLIGFFDLRVQLVLALRVEPAPGQRRTALHFDNIDAAHDVAGAFFHFGQAFAWALASVRVAPAPPRLAADSVAAVAGSHADSSLDRAVETLTSLSLTDLATRFESLGNTCELGILQLQLLGHEQASLLRTSGILQRELVEGLAQDFSLLGRPDTIEWIWRPEPDDTWRLISGIYELSNPTPYPRAAPVPPEATPRAARAMAWLAAKFITDQHEGGKIYVLRLPVSAAIEAAALAVLAMLRRRSEAPLLWLVADGSTPRGSVDRLPSGLLRGQLGAEAAGRGIDTDVLISVLAGAWMLGPGTANPKSIEIGIE